MRVYIDNEYKCHVTNIEGLLREVECVDLNGACAEYIEGHRVIPHGETWTNEKGITFKGYMIAPWKPFDELEAAQREYERELARVALIMLGEV